MYNLNINSVNFNKTIPILPANQPQTANSHPCYAQIPMPAAVVMPVANRNYCLFNQDKVDYFVKQKELGLPYLKEVLKHSNNEDQITETLYILDRMIEVGTKGIDKIYPLLSRFNNTNSPNIQTFLAGIYRKIQVPDAFGPLVAMLIRNSINQTPSCFDANEEVGGAILSYLSDRFRD